MLLLLLLFYALVLHTQGLKISKYKMYVRNGYLPTSEHGAVSEATAAWW